MAFTPNQRGLTQLGRSPGVVAALGRHADRVADEARRRAPVATGAYRDSIEAEVGMDAQGPVGRVNAHDFKSLWIEFGSVRQPPLAVLRRALDATRGR